MAERRRVRSARVADMPAALPEQDVRALGEAMRTALPIVRRMIQAASRPSASGGESPPEPPGCALRCRLPQAGPAPPLSRAPRAPGPGPGTVPPRRRTGRPDRTSPPMPSPQVGNWKTGRRAPDRAQWTGAGVSRTSASAEGVLWSGRGALTARTENSADKARKATAHQYATLKPWTSARSVAALPWP